MGYSVFAGAGQWRAAKDDAQAMGFFGLDQTSGAWTAITEGLPSDVEVRDIVVRPDAPETLFAGTQYGLYHGTDDGAHWEKLALPDEDIIVWSILHGKRKVREIAVPVFTVLTTLCAQNSIEPCQHYALLGDPSLRLNLRSVEPAMDVTAAASNRNR